MTSLIDKEIISEGADFEFYKTDWVPLYYDTGYAVTSDCGKITAYRAATLRGQLLWLVFSDGKARGYHALDDDPVAAIERAKAVWTRRSMVRKNWRDVEDAARDLITGRQKFDVRMEDAEASPLCVLGIEGFLRNIGMARVRKLPGPIAAILMKVEPQMGFVIFEALQRHRKTATQGPATVPAE
jgi:hypothetical protein